MNCVVLRICHVFCTLSIFLYLVFEHIYKTSQTTIKQILFWNFLSVKDLG